MPLTLVLGPANSAKAGEVLGAGFKGRSGRSFRARLALQQADEGKWRVEFDEPWAKEGAKPPEAEAEAGGAASEEPAAA